MPLALKEIVLNKRILWAPRQKFGMVYHQQKLLWHLPLQCGLALPQHYNRECGQLNTCINMTCLKKEENIQDTSSRRVVHWKVSTLENCPQALLQTTICHAIWRHSLEFDVRDVSRQKWTAVVFSLQRPELFVRWWKQRHWGHQNKIQRRRARRRFHQLTRNMRIQNPIIRLNYVGFRTRTIVFEDTTTSFGKTA